MLCNQMKGVSRKAAFFNLKRICNIGARLGLPNDHILRYYGMSKQCCPKGYYEGSDASIENIRLLYLNATASNKERDVGVVVPAEVNAVIGTAEKIITTTTTTSTAKNGNNKRTLSTTVPLFASSSNNSNKKKKANENDAVESHPKRVLDDERPEGCDGYLFQPHNTSSFDPASRYNKMLFNNKYVVQDFEAYLDYAHCALSRRVAYKRRPNKTYKGDRSHSLNVEDALDDLTLNAHLYSEIPDADLYTEEEVILTKQFLEEVGVHSVWVYDSLHSARIKRALVYDPFHALSNLIKDIIAFLKGDRATEHATLRLCQIEGRFKDILVPPPVLKGASGPVVTAVEEVAAETTEGRTTTSTTTANSSSGTSMPAAATTTGFAIGTAPTTAAGSGRKNTKKINKQSSVSSASRHKRKIPWLMTVADQNKTDCFHNCIMVPIGLVDKFCSKNPIDLPGQLKGHDKIQFLTTFISFDLYYTSLTQEYKNLIDVISRITCDICAVVLDPDPPEATNFKPNNKTAVELYKAHYSLSPIAIFNRTQEMLALYEAMLPDSECQFTHHQLQDITYAMRILGPIRNFWAYPGERFMKSVTDMVNDGGLQPLLTVARNHAKLENCVTHTYEVNKQKLDNKFRYRDNMIKLLRTHDKKKNTLNYDNFWTPWVHAKLLECICLSLDNASTSTDVQHRLLLKSSFFRLFTSFKRYQDTTTAASKKNNPLPFIEWLTLIVAGGDDTVRAMINRVVSVEEFNPEEGVDDAEDIEVAAAYVLDDGCLFSVDLVTALAALELKPTEVFSLAIIKGLLFRSRGEEYSEITEQVVTSRRYGQQIVDEIPAQQVNNLAKHWEHEAQYSSWFKPDQDNYKFMYGQFNYFFRLRMPSDKYLHGLAIGNCIMRRVTTPNNCKAWLPLIQLKASRNDAKRGKLLADKSYVEDHQFIFLHEVCMSLE